MSCFSALIFVLQIVGFSKAELKLDILQNFNGMEVPISNVLEETVGANLILTCTLVSSSVDNTSYFDNEVSWGWSRANVQFQNVADLEKLVNNTSRPLLQFLNKSDLNQATIAFHPLSHTDSGKYFCMSLKYKLFHVLKIDIVGNKTLRKHNTLLRPKRFNEKASVLIPKNYCTNDMFVCNSRTSCVKYEYVCDSVKDCKDGSDENEHVCGSRPCEGKTNCSNGRCISQWLCCDYNKNASCIFNPGPSCCSEIVRANKATYITSHNIAKDTVGLKDDRWTYRGGFEGGENNWNDFNNPALKNSHGLVTRNRVNYNHKLNDSSSNTKRGTRRKFLWILLSPIIVIMTVLGTLTKMWNDKCRTVSSNPENVNPSISTNTPEQIYEYGTPTDAQENDRNLDLPPSYDEAIRTR